MCITSDAAKRMDCKRSVFAAVTQSSIKRSDRVNTALILAPRVKLRYMGIWANMFTCKRRGLFSFWLKMCDILYNTKAQGQKHYLLKFYHLKGWDFKSSCRYGVQDLSSQACEHIKAVHICEPSCTFPEVYTYW